MRGYTGHRTRDSLAVPESRRSAWWEELELLELRDDGDVTVKECARVPRLGPVGACRVGAAKSGTTSCRVISGRVASRLAVARTHSHTDRVIHMRPSLHVWDRMAYG